MKNENDIRIRDAIAEISKIRTTEEEFTDSNLYNAYILI